MDKRYSKLIQIKNFKERIEYLTCDGNVGEETFGAYRYLNQRLYNSIQWKKIRREVIVRDNGFDLAHIEYPIRGTIYVHHINPLTINDILECKDCVFDLENLVSVSFLTHNLIHYGNKDAIQNELVVRTPYDTCPWR